MRDVVSAIWEGILVLAWAVLLGFVIALMFVSTTPGMLQW